MTNEKIDPSSCPLCGKSNNCGNLAGLPSGTCWCSKAEFPPEIFELIPEDQRRKACICKACLEKFG